MTLHYRFLRYIHFPELSSWIWPPTRREISIKLNFSANIRSSRYRNMEKNGSRGFVEWNLIPDGNWNRSPAIARQWSTHVSVPLQLLLLRWLTDAGVWRCDWSREAVSATVYGSLNLPLRWSLLLGLRLRSSSLAPRFTYPPWSESRDELKYRCDTEYTYTN